MNNLNSQTHSQNIIQQTKSKSKENFNNKKHVKNFNRNIRAFTVSLIATVTAHSFSSLAQTIIGLLPNSTGLINRASFFVIMFGITILCAYIFTNISLG